MARDFTKDTVNSLDVGVGGFDQLLHGAPALSMHCWAEMDTKGDGSDASAGDVVDIRPPYATEDE